MKEALMVWTHHKKAGHPCPHRISSNSCSFCHNNLSVSFVAHLTKFLPKGVIPIFLLNDRCTEQASSSIMEEIYMTSKGVVLQSITFQSSDETDSTVTRLQDVILTMSKRTQNIYIFCVCVLHPGLVPLRNCRKTETNFIIDGPDIEYNNCSQRIKIGKWITKRWKLLPGKPNDFFRFTKRLHFTGREVTVASADTFPFFVHEYDSNGKLHVKDGIDVKIIQALAQKFNFRLRHVPSIDKRFGAKLSNGSWNGLIGMVRRQEAEIAISDLGMSNARAEVIDYTYPYVKDQINFLVQAPREKPRALAIIRPFSLEMWIAILAVVLTTSLVTGLVAKKTIGPETKNWTFQKSLWYYCGALTFQGADELPDRDSQRIIIGGYWLFAIIIVAGFSGSLTSFMNVPGKELPIDTISELARRVQNKQIKVGTVPNSLTCTNLMSGTKGDLAIISNDIKNDIKGTLVENKENGAIKAMKEPYAFTWSGTLMEGVLVNLGIREYHFCKSVLSDILYSVVLAKGSPMTEPFSKALRQLNEGGLIDKWKRDVLDRRARENAFSKNNNSSPMLISVNQGGPRALTLEDVQGSFILISVGHGLSIVVFLLELFYSRHKMKSVKQLK
ncbi:putative glutamate receptor [Tachypleus tridentatus]|uniref:putative glutamate receptor n=1 Tax=Tachypleus tridentatus TaxID=6853 RepID=UPI003FD1BACA